MSKPVLTVARENSQGRYQEENLIGTRIKREPVLFLVTLDHVILYITVLKLHTLQK